jgi:hypothetical protein
VQERASIAAAYPSRELHHHDHRVTDLDDLLAVVVPALAQELDVPARHA